LLAPGDMRLHARGMKANIRRSLPAALVCFSVALATLGSGVRADTGPIIEYTACKDPRLVAVVSAGFVTNTPDWEPGEKMPVTPQAAAAAARTELQRHLPDADKLIYARVDIISNPAYSSKHYYLVYFRRDLPEPGAYYRNIMVPVNFSGTASRLLKPGKENGAVPQKGK
jgi:hypothetical protein